MTKKPLVTFLKCWSCGASMTQREAFEVGVGGRVYTERRWTCGCGKKERTREAAGEPLTMKLI